MIVPFKTLYSTEILCAFQIVSTDRTNARTTGFYLRINTCYDNGDGTTTWYDKDGRCDCTTSTPYDEDDD